jgi:hypothetical protein
MGPEDTNPETHRRELEEEFAAVLTINDPEVRVGQILELAPKLPQEILDEALTDFSRISSEKLRGHALAGLAPHLGRDLITRALVIGKQMSQTEFRFEALGALGRYANDPMREEIIQEISSWQIPETRLRGWLELIEYLPPNKKEEAISTALRLPEDDRADALVRVARQLSPKWKMQALVSIKSMTLTEPKVRALCALIPVLVPKDRANALNDALSLSRGLPATSRAEATITLLPFMPEELRSELLEETIRAGESSPVWQERLHVFLRVASVVDGDPKLGLFTRCLALVDELTNDLDKSDALIVIARATPSWFRDQILETARRIKDSEIRSSLRIQLEGIFAGQGEATFSPVRPPPSDSPDGAAAGSGAYSYEPDAAPDPDASTQATPPSPATPTNVPHHDLARGASATLPVSLDLTSSPGITLPTNAPTSPPNVTLPAVAPASPSPSVEAVPKSKAAKPKATRKRAAKPVPPETELPQPDTDFEPIGVKTYLHSDKWTLDDQLNYSLYAEAIAEFIRHEDTHPPLAIGVLAPWGQGKTTLMKLIQDKLATKAKAATAPPPSAAATSSLVDPEQSNPLRPVPGNDASDRPAPPGRRRFRFADLKEWLRDPDYSPSVQKLHYPTVWFNAWKYQNSEQLWAAMAYCILNELVSQIPTQLEREKFWLALQAERIDFAEVRRDIHRVIFESIAPWLVLWFGFALIGIMLFALGLALPSRTNVLSIAGPATFSISFLACVGQWLVARTRVHRKPLEGKFAQYVRQPTYEGKLGFFHEVEEDVRRVFKLLVSQKEPVVIFIDDLDRCSPGTVAQVIEAMNLFLSADFPDCYFIVGMDAQVVAASMEVAYENLDRKLKSVTRSYGSLGWYFMDKFIQLQFNIPNLNKEMRHGYLAKLFGHESSLLKNGGSEKQPTEEELNKIQADVAATFNKDVILPGELAQKASEVAKLRLFRPQQWQIQSRTLIETGAKQLSDNSPTLQKYLDDYKDLLGSSPRAIKRFANLYRFYSLTQYARQTQGLEASSPAALARWLVIMLRWPQLVRWIQWENETKLTSATDANGKASALEDQVCATRTYEAWVKHLEEVDPTQGDWLRDKHLYEFLKMPVAIDRKLSIAVQNGVW